MGRMKEHHTAIIEESELGIQNAKSKEVKETQQSSKRTINKPFVQDPKGNGQKEIQTKVQGGAR